MIPNSDEPKVKRPLVLIGLPAPRGLIGRADDIYFLIHISPARLLGVGEFRVRAVDTPDARCIAEWSYVYSAEGGQNVTGSIEKNPVESFMGRFPESR